MEKKEKTNIYQKLIKVQKHIMGLGKDKQAFGYKYVTGDKLMGELKPLMNELGLLLKQEIISITNTRQDYTTKNGNKSEILSNVMMKFTWVDSETGEKDENLFGANGQNDWDKGVGSALTYGERYFLLKYFHIATDEDDIDNPDRKPEVKAQPVVNVAKAEPVAKVLLELAKNTETWNKAVASLADGIVTMEQARGKYKIDPPLEAELIEAVKLVQANRLVKA